MQMPGALTTAARAHYDAAVLAYGEARDVLAKPKPTVADVQAAGAALETGLRAARRTRAVLEGRPPEAADQEPLLEGMCSFDPKHGKATTTVTITTPSGDKAELPACANCAAQMAAGEQPQFREVEQNGRRVPYWQTGPMGMGGGRGAAGASPARCSAARWPGSSSAGCSAVATPRPQAVSATPARGAAAEAATSGAAAAPTSGRRRRRGLRGRRGLRRRGRRGLLALGAGATGPEARRPARSTAGGRRPAAALDPVGPGRLGLRGRAGAGRARGRERRAPAPRAVDDPRGREREARPGPRVAEAERHGHAGQAVGLVGRDEGDGAAGAAGAGGAARRGGCRRRRPRAGRS